jgi:hypothetical protein
MASKLDAQENALCEQYKNLYAQAVSFEYEGDFRPKVMEAARLGIIDEQNCQTDFGLTTQQFNATVKGFQISIGPNIRNSCMTAVAEACAVEGKISPDELVR